MARKKKEVDEDEEQKPAPKTTTLAQFMAVTNKSLGERTVATGLDAKRDPPRIPFGVFAVDFASGGGLPLWGTAGAYGPESGGKTTLALNAVDSVANHCWRCFQPKAGCVCSQSPLLMKSFWADAEGTLDPPWAACVGADPASYYYCLAEYGEQYINLAEHALRADDCGLVVVDSLAALTPAAVLEADSEDQFIGAQARMITRAVQRLKQRLVRERRREHPCCLLFTNQIRKKIGVMFGDPETMPGGHALFHEFSLLLRVVKKSLDKKRAADKKYLGDKDKAEKDKASRHSFVIRKEKLLTLASSGEFLRLKQAVDGRNKGEIDDYASVARYAESYGILYKEGKTWVCRDRNSTNLLDLVTIWRGDRNEYRMLQRDIILAAKRRIGAIDAE